MGSGGGRIVEDNGNIYKGMVVSNLRSSYRCEGGVMPRGGDKGRDVSKRGRRR